MKYIIISDECHNLLKEYCERYNQKLNKQASDMLLEYLNLLKMQKEKG